MCRQVARPSEMWSAQLCDYHALTSSVRISIRGMALSQKKRQGKWMAWLALVALWLTIGMPVLSRSLPERMDAMELGGWCTEHGLSDHHRTAPANPATTDRCGYCSLFCHSPLIAGCAGMGVPPSALPLQSSIALAGNAGPAPRVLSARPRGPPTLA